MSFSGHFLFVEGQVGAFLFSIISSFSLLCPPSSLPPLLPTLSFPVFFPPSVHCQDILSRLQTYTNFLFSVALTRFEQEKKTFFHSLVITVLGNGLVPLKWWSLAVHTQQCKGPSLGLPSFFNFKLFLLMKLSSIFYVHVYGCFTCMLVCAHAWCPWMPELGIGFTETGIRDSFELLNRSWE